MQENVYRTPDDRCSVKIQVPVAASPTEAPKVVVECLCDS